MTDQSDRPLWVDQLARRYPGLENSVCVVCGWPYATYTATDPTKAHLPRMEQMVNVHKGCMIGGKLPQPDGQLPETVHPISDFAAEEYGKLIEKRALHNLHIALVRLSEGFPKEALGHLSGAIREVQVLTAIEEQRRYKVPGDKYSLPGLHLRPIDL